MENNSKTLVQEDSLKRKKIVMKIVPGWGIYSKFFYPVQEFSSRLGQLDWLDL